MLRRRILNRRNVTGVRGDASNLDDLDRLFDTVKRETMGNVRTRTPAPHFVRPRMAATALTPAAGIANSSIVIGPNAQRQYVRALRVVI
jgi:hypothetical protein